jgi:hypothetical protein
MLDFAVANGDSNNVSLFLGSGAGAFQAAVDYNVVAGLSAVTSSDLNGDHRLDLVTTNRFNSKGVSVLLNGCLR